MQIEQDGENEYLVIHGSLRVKTEDLVALLFSGERAFFRAQRHGNEVELQKFIAREKGILAGPGFHVEEAPAC